jgi:hypothetical protein
MTTTDRREVQWRDGGAWPAASSSDLEVFSRVLVAAQVPLSVDLVSAVLITGIGISLGASTRRIVLRHLLWPSIWSAMDCATRWNRASATADRPSRDAHGSWC